ncbi:hypothetical protein [Parvibaculum sp.]|uniref:hypothetical protein n=1 Tax=Parvibaculum sp. TaxID=2024848 RepID=UPI001B035D9C|nr:hypothetical protein [Parvibaculum sp.]MBO6633002.1 hypothetical protein [Parvibaculum sp.]MBO6679391.1 hypothetical protein [Parvibaculum sp.]MBO6684422.1 hypothetical protein [Parvibaculum sp.]MBO6904218.1 hypothetical protein [Parvibaculum sp.]
MTHRSAAHPCAVKRVFLPLLAVIGLALGGCVMAPPEEESLPLFLELPPDAPKESVLDDLEPGVAGELSPKRYSMRELVAEIEEMQRRCQRGDEFRDDYRERYRRLRQQLQDGANKEAAALQAAGKDPYEDERIRYMHEALVRLEANPDCRKQQVVGYEPEFGASVDGGIGVARLGLPGYRFLGTEVGAIPNLSNGYSFEDEETTSVQQIGGGIDLPWRAFGSTRLSLRLSLMRTSVDIDRNTGAFDPSGATLLIPGTGDGPSGAGFSLASAGGLNVVTTSNYRLKLDSDAFYAKVMGEYWCDDDYDDEEPGIGFFPYVGVRYTDSDFRQSFGGSIPGYGRDFEYNTVVDTKSWGPIAGFQIAKPISGSAVALRAGVTASIEFNDASGSDSLDFTGFGRQTMRVSNDDTTLSYGVNAGVTVGATAPIRFDVDAFAGSSGNTPVVTRDGVRPSQLEMERTDYIGATLRTTFRF